MDTDLFARVFVTVLVIMDPVGNIPVFLTLTRGEPSLRSRAALVATSVAGGVILGFALFGEWLLQLLSISVEALQVSGGLVLVLVALELLGLGDVHERAHGGAARNVAFVPLGTPLLAGPAAIAATMVYMRQADGAGDAMTVTAALVGVLAAVFLTLRFAAALGRVVNDNAIDLLSRIVGLILGAIAVQMIAEGVEAWVRHGVA